ncbi:MAG: hypothetical protein COB09_00890 [Thalassobium sp.]|jgi:hypothetical protein|nr:MAG: hypothetical protein COB09_00890 [Thalassobium sp.]
MTVWCQFYDPDVYFVIYCKVGLWLLCWQGMADPAKNMPIVSFFHLLLPAASGYYRACRV